MLISAAVAVASTVLTAFGLFGLWALLAARRTGDQQAPNGRATTGSASTTAYLEVISSRLAALEVTVAGLPGLYNAAVSQAEEERERAKNFNNRALQAERRVREILEEDEDELDPEEQVARIQQLDELRSTEDGVHPLLTPLELAPEDYDRIARANAQAQQYGL